jgi:hypothetical protein
LLRIEKLGKGVAAGTDNYYDSGRFLRNVEKRLMGFRLLWKAASGVMNQKGCCQSSRSCLDYRIVDVFVA